MPKLLFTIFVFFAAVTLVSACLPTFEQHKLTMKRVASPAWMIERQIPADPYLITAYERIHKFGAPAHVYIEGDGKLRVSKRSFSRSPTPHNPIALHMAAKDKARNVVYLARPCQVTQHLDPEVPCHYNIWAHESYTPEIVETYHKVLNELKARYEIREFHLIGYQGGAAIAGLLTAQREDILSFRSVAGRLNEIGNPVALFDTPQMHFIAENDEIIPGSLLDQYLVALGPSPCVTAEIVSETDSENGWANRWADLLKKPVICGNAGAFDMPLHGGTKDVFPH